MRKKKIKFYSTREQEELRQKAINKLVDVSKLQIKVKGKVVYGNKGTEDWKVESKDKKRKVVV